ncbi:MAG: hypothetical protein Q9163_002077 [Psora crenata]
MEEDVEKLKQGNNSSLDMSPPPAYSPLSEIAPSQEESDGQAPEHSQMSCKDSVSSANDFDPDNSMNSQQTEATEVTQPLRSRASLVESEHLHAETLRLRLRLAQFKVRTNQVDVPFARLQVSTEEKPDTQSSRESTVQPDPQPSLPQLLPAPVLQPTAYSARTILQPHMLSSPPASPVTSPNRGAVDNVFKTPALPRRQVTIEAQQLSSPPGSQEGCTRAATEEGFTSSATKGTAAISLLGLRDQHL